MRKFIVIHNIPSPYRVHLFTELWKALNNRGIEFHVHFMSKENKIRPVYWRDPEMQFPHTYWSDCGYKSYHLNLGMIVFLLFQKPADFILLGSGFDSFTGLLATFFAPRKKSILWTESNTKTPGKTTGIRGLIKRLVFLHHDYISVPPGIEGKKYVELYQSFSKKKFPPLIPLPNLVDERLFTDMKESLDVRDKTRKTLGILENERMALCPARLEPCKGLLEFFSALPLNSLKNWKIVVIGEGYLLGSLKELLKKRGLDAHVLIEKYVPYKEMPKLYAAADLFLLPSIDDPNPLSVVEALHTGLPLLLSNHVGNFSEALIEGVTGWGFSPCNPSEIAVKAGKAFNATDSELREMGIQAKKLAQQQWDTEKSIRDFLNALEI
jgi:glycosyltransferase involved in cell wall biosynthesis